MCAGCTKSRACHAKATGRAAETKGHRTDTGGHWGVHPTPLHCTKSHACHAKATGRAAETKGRQRDTGGHRARGVHPTPVHCTKSHACHAKASGGDQGTPEGRQRDGCQSGGCVCVWVGLGRQAGGGGRSGYSTKNKKPTRQCGELIYSKEVEQMKLVYFSSLSLRTMCASHMCHLAAAPPHAGSDRLSIEGPGAMPAALLAVYFGLLQ